MNEACPVCRENGRDNTGDNLKRYKDGSGFCFHPECRTYFKAGDDTGSRRGTMSKLTIGEVQTYGFGTSGDRNISSATASKYGVRCSVDTSTGEPDTVYYPSFDEDDHKRVIGYKVRRLPKDFRPSVGTIGKTLAGVNTINPKARKLLITEGEEDMMAAWEMCGTPNVNILSLPNGAALSHSNSKAAYEIYEAHDVVYLCLDPDSAGKSGATDIADYISRITEVRLVELDKMIGDPSDYHRAGKAGEFKKAIATAKQYEPEGIVNGIDINLADLLVPRPEGVTIPFAGVQEKLHGLRKGEITTICAGSGIGKSTFVREIVLSLIEQGQSVANVALENQMEETMQYLMAMDMEIPMGTFMFHPPDEAACKPSFDKVIANGNTYFYKHFAGITADSLMNKLYYYARSKAVDFIVLDHLSLVISATDTQNERKAIDTLMTDLAKLVVETGVGLIQVVHLKRGGDGKNFAKGAEVELTDLRGSAALEQLSWNVIGVERDQQGDSRDFSKARVLKNRLFGFTGIADHMKYDPSTGRMKSIDPEDIEDDDIGAIADPEGEAGDTGLGDNDRSLHDTISRLLQTG